jgi:hypothetical protein
MRILGLAIAAGALLAATHANAGTFPVNAGLIGSGSDLIDQVAVRVYVHEGNRYCFYFNGWHGPGWYRCGFAFRRGLGWGGVYGWNSWSYAPYERRYGRHHHGERIGVESGSRRGERMGVETRTRRMDGSMDSRTTTRSSTGVETRSRSTTGSGSSEGRARVRGSSPNADVQSEGSGKMQGGPTGEGSSAPALPRAETWAVPRWAKAIRDDKLIQRRHAGPRLACLFQSIILCLPFQRSAEIRALAAATRRLA